MYCVLLETLGVSVMDWDLRPSLRVVFLDNYNMLAVILAFPEQANGWLRHGRELSWLNGVS